MKAAIVTTTGHPHTRFINNNELISLVVEQQTNLDTCRDLPEQQKFYEHSSSTTTAQQATKSRKKLTLDQIKSIVKKKEIICKSNIYLNSRTNLIWECKKKHIWSAKYRSGHISCPTCSSKKYTIEDIKKLALLNGGECLSEEYKNAHAKLTWKCKEGHLWITSSDSIRRGTWCPYCNHYIGEKILRAYCNILFEKTFIKSKPGWLVYNGSRLELDCYSSSLNLAFEYDGLQHTTYSSFFHGTLKKFNDSISRDIFKEKTCIAKGICFIRVPYATTKQDILINLINLCNKKNLIYNKTNVTQCNNLDVTNLSEITRLHHLASSKAGKCLSYSYEGNHIKLTWGCDMGHVWKATPGHIKAGKWCPYCVGKYKTIKDMQQLAALKQGFCLSNNYIRSDIKLQWKCSNGHIWFAIPDNIRQGKWCPECKRLNTIKRLTKYNIIDMQAIAKEKNGKCLSNIYVNYNSRLMWECESGHMWETKPSNIFSGTWCPVCVGKKPKGTSS